MENNTINSGQKPIQNKSNLLYPYVYNRAVSRQLVSNEDDTRRRPRFDPLTGRIPTLKVHIKAKRGFDSPRKTGLLLAASFV